MDKRTFIKKSVLGTGLILGGSKLLKGNFVAETKNSGSSAEIAADAASDLYIQPPLGYAYNVLEPYIDALTMEIHYSRHHAAYTKNLNTALADLGIKENNIGKLLSGISTYPAAIRNNAGGFYNHNLFWQFIAPGGSKNPGGMLADKINSAFGSVENFKTAFTKKAMEVFGSGWTWLILQNQELKIANTANQDNPLMDVAVEKGTPLLCVDVWEHAYYLKYQNKRKDYADNFWNVVNWDRVQDMYRSATGG